MNGSDQDNIIYEDTEAEGPDYRIAAIALLVAAAALGLASFGWWLLGPVRDLASVPKISFDGSASQTAICDQVLEQLPDFSIVISGAEPGGAAFPQVRQFVIVLGSLDPRYGRSVNTEVICSVP